MLQIQRELEEATMRTASLFVDHWFDGFCACPWGECVFRDHWVGVELNGAEGAD